VTGIILLVLGINIIKPLKELFSPLFKSSDKEGGIMEKGGAIFKKLSKRSLGLGAFFLGILFAVGWAPCAISLVFPVFILVLTQETSLLMGGLLLFVFGVGHGVPIIPLTTFTSGMRAKLGNSYVSAGKIVQKIFAGVIIMLAVIFMLRYFGIRLW
jgi:cytochrome c-type biogenesis protein